MTANKIIEWHNQNLSEFRATPEGDRNNALNEKAGASFQLAYGNNGALSVSTVENDFLDAALAKGLEKQKSKNSIESARKWGKANPRTIDDDYKPEKKQVEKDRASYKVDLPVSDLAQYAKDHNATEQDFVNAGWKVGEHQGRKCFIVPHSDGIDRARFLDSGDPKWKPVKSGAQPVWYGLDRAITLARDKTIVMCNGQPSVIAGQTNGVPAFAQTDGEGKEITPQNLKMLVALCKEHGLKVVIALDGDDTGRKYTPKRTKQLQDNNIDVGIVYFGGNDGYDLADYCQHKEKTFDKLLKLADYSKHEVTPIMTGKDMARQFEQTLVYPAKSLPTGEMIVNPMRRMRKYGGMAAIFQPGMMTEIIAASGGGKTSFMETWLDDLRKRGYVSFWYSPEWSPQAMHLRTVQRHGGAPSDAIWNSLLWYSEEARGIPEHQREGKRLDGSSDVWRKSIAVNNTILKKWPGDVHCFQSAKVTEHVLEQMSERLFELRRNDTRIGLIFFDYAQLLRTKEEEVGRNSYELIINNIKTWCEVNHVHAVVGSQTNKDLGRDNIEKGRVLTKYDSNWVAPNEFNLILTLNIVYDGKDPATDEPIRTNRARVNIAKNSTGQEKVMQMKTDFKHLRWIDCAW